MAGRNLGNEWSRSSLDIFLNHHLYLAGGSSSRWQRRREAAGARRRQQGGKEKIDTHTRMDPGASVMVHGGGPVLSAWFAEECNRILGEKLTEAEERISADLVYKARVRALKA